MFTLSISSRVGPRNFESRGFLLNLAAMAVAIQHYFLVLYYSFRAELDKFSSCECSKMG